MVEDTGTSHFEVLHLEDASRIAKTLSSPTSRKILDFLEKTESSTATDLSSELDIALSTIHYHLKALAKAGIVDDSSFHYSEKGKEVIHYSLRDKAIIILPRKNTSSSSLRKQLQSLVPGILTIAAIAGVSLLYKGIEGSKEKVYAAAPRMMEAAADMPPGGITPTSSPSLTFSSLFSSPEFLIGLGSAFLIIVLSVIGMQLLRTSREHDNKEKPYRKRKKR